MKKGNIDFKELPAKAKNVLLKFSKHASFAAILVVLLVYVFVVLKINSLANAEPSDEAQSTALSGTNIPKVDQKAIDQIQSLEQNSPQVHSLFEKARNNPFQE